MTGVCWLVFVYVLWSINPMRTNWIGFLLFYITLFMSLVGTAAVVGFLIRFVALRQTLAFKSVKEAFRQSFLFSALIVVGLNMMANNLFSWMNLFFLVLGLTILEFFLLSYEKN